MKKQEAGKKSLKWIILTAVVVLVAVAAALYMTVFSGDDTGDVQATAPTQTQDADASQIKIYWNVDRDAYVDDEGNNLRMRVGEYYRLRFAVDGEQIDLFFENFAMVEKVDSMLFAGMIVDENNVVRQVLDVHEFTGGLTAYEYYVTEVGETQIKLNSTANAKGLDWVLRITPETQVYNVGGTGLLVGLPGKVEVGSCVYAVMDENGYTTHIFVMPPFEASPVYWNVERMYDSAGKVTTRKRDELGYFNFTFAVNGEQVKLRTMDVDVASQVDSFAAKCMHLEFNEDGTIAEAVHARVATGGRSLASWYHVLEMNTHESSFFARKFAGSDKGSEVTANWHNDVKVYDCSGKGAFVGEPTELRLFDQIHCLTNPYDQVTVIFVVSRPVESELYYNLERMWDSTNKVSTRNPAADGYYYIKFAVNGEHVTLRTKDPEVVKTIDSRAAKVLGFDLQGDEILKAYAPSNVFGCTTTVFDYTKVTGISDSGEITTTRNGKTYIATLNDNTKVFNVSSNASKVGEETTVMVGDTLYGFTDMHGKLTYVFVTSRRNQGPLYWNLDRSYDSTNKVSKRTRAADGYYHIALSDGTATKNFKTTDKALVDQLDSYVACGVTAYNGIISKVYKYDTIMGYTGGGYASWSTVTSVNGSSFTSKDTKSTYSGYVAGKIYDVSQGSKTPVTETTLRVGDRIHAIKDENKNIVVVFVVGRTVDVPMYYNLQRLWDDDRKVSTRKPDASGYYVFKMACNGTHVEVKTKDAAIVKTIDGRAAKVLGLDVKNGIIQKAYLPSQVASTSTTVFDYTSVTKVAADGTITTTRNGKTYTAKLNKDTKVFNVSSNAALVGEKSTVLVGDTVYGFTNKQGSLTYVFVTSRRNQGPLYWNLDRSYDTANKVSTRTCDADGYYHIALADGTTTRNFKTTDKALVDQLDSYVACGVVAQNDVIVKVYKYDSIAGYTGGGYASWSTVTSVDGASFTSKDGATVYSGQINGKVYDVSKGSKAPVTETTLRVGDRIHAVMDENKNIVLVFVVGRPVDVPLYYNLERLWDDEQKISTRVPDAEGYYVFKMAFDGAHVELKTKDTAIVNTIDGRTAKVMGLDVRDGVIQKAYLPSQVASTSTTTFDYCVVTAIAQDGTITASRDGKTYTGKPAEDCKIFNVSSDAQLIGEKCTVEVGDTLYGFENKDGQVTYIYVVRKVAKVPTREAQCTVCGETVTWKAWDGKVALDNGHWYLDENVSVSSTADIKKNTAVCFDLNGHSVDATVRIFNVLGTFNVLDYAGNGTVTSTATVMAPIFYVRDGATMNLYGGKLIGTDRARSAVGAVGDASTAAVNGTFNLYGGEMVGAAVTGSGGVMELFHASVMNVHGGTITAGSAATGSAISMASRSVLNVLGGTVAGKSGTAASINMVGTMTVSGDARILGGDENLYLPEGKTISVGELGENAQIHVTMAAGSGVFATDAVEADKDHFYADNERQITFADGKLSIEAPTEPIPGEHKHCICGGAGELGDHTCEEVTWEAWTGTVKDDGHYFLTDNLSVGSTITIGKNTTVSICLNGYKMTGTVRVFNVQGILNICDHTGNGTVTSTATSMAPIFYVRDGATMNLYGGKLIGTDRARSAVGAVGDSSTAAVNGTFNLYGGEMVGAAVTGGGGVMELFHASVMNIYGGTVTAGSAATGSAISMGSRSVLNVLGGTVAGKPGTAASINMVGTMTVSGDARILGGDENLYLPEGKTISIGELGENAEIHVTVAAGSGVFATNAVEEDKTHFYADNDGLITFADGKLSIEAPAEPEPDGHKHCVCGGLGSIGDHTACTQVQWQPWTGTFEDGGYYYLTEDFDLTAQIVVPEGTSLKLCLNGHDIKGANSVNRMFNIYGALTICDHAAGDVYNGDVISNYQGSNTQTGRVFYVQNKAGAALHLFGGNLTSTTSGKNGGIGGLTREMKVYAGTVSGGVASGNGGNLILEGAKSTTVLTVYGGTIGSVSTDRNTANAAGNIYIESGKVILDGGQILGGIAKGSGGSIRINANGSFELKKGTVSGGKSAEYSGGNLYVAGGSLVITGGSVENGEALGTAGGLGGNVYVNAGSVTVSGGAVTGGKAINGGNFAVKVDGASVSNCTVSGGAATLGKDIYFEKADGTLTLSGVIDTLELILQVYVANGNLVTDALDPATQINITTP